MARVVLLLLSVLLVTLATAAAAATPAAIAAAAKAAASIRASAGRRAGQGFGIGIGASGCVSLGVGIGGGRGGGGRPCSDNRGGSSGGNSGGSSGGGSSGGSPGGGITGPACDHGKCDDNAGSLDYWRIPECGECASIAAGSMPVAGDKAWCVGGSDTELLDAKDCCALCKSTNATASDQPFNCRFWAHIPSNGSCVLLPAIDILQPVRSTEEKSNGHKLRIGKRCPYSENDPHFLGAHGTRFDFNGLPEKNFCLYTDKQVHVNMGMRGYLDSRSTQNAALVINGSAVRTWIRQLAVMWTDNSAAADSDNTVAAKPVTHSLVLTARDGNEQLRGESGFLASVELDSAAIPRLAPGESRSLAGGKLSLQFVAEEKVGPYDVDHYYLRLDGLLELDLKLRPAHPLLQTPEDSQVHINLMFMDVSASSSVHGVMGQTYRGGRESRTMEFSRLAALLHHPVSADGEEGRGFLDGQVGDYETSAVAATDCRFSAFNGQQLPVDN
ncbi:hypothetical protein CLOM_g10056 [Closterium sp. NIES-68]|nr:hypothetical protein CLOM_g10056 [Closterium sp. NIES-68]GJP58772.1 hypothetical protein CLOP_g3381 [Closterium sp. NIES-67]